MWLGEEPAETFALKALLAPLPSEDMTCWPVSARVGNVKTASGKQPYAIALADRRLMALAGLWENWRSPAGEWVRSFAIITTTPNVSPCP